MEKRTAHYLLTDVKALVSKNSVFATKTALAGAAALNFDFEDMKEVIQNIETRDFYKSMTSNADNRIWQDVYHYPSEEAGDLYIKLCVIEDVLIVSFKEL